MKVGITAVGSRGDIEPFAALAYALGSAGHEVLMSAPADSAEMVAAAGASLVPMDLDVRAHLRSPEGQEWLASGNVRAILAGGRRLLSEAKGTITKSILAIAEDADVLVSGVNVDDYAIAVAQARRLPLLLGHLNPFLRTREFPNPLVSTAALRPGALAAPLNLTTHRLALGMYWRGKRDDVNAFRASLALDPAPDSAVGWAPRLNLTVLHGYSAEVVPRPRDWGPRNLLTGYWRLPREVHTRLGETVACEDLADWLADGPPPVFFSFGSAPVPDLAPYVALAVEAAQRAGARRVLIGAGWSEVAGIAATLPPSARVVDAIDHDWLLPQCQAIVHHGGAGTTGGGLVAGLPTWIYHWYFDQPYWGSRVARLGVGGHDKFANLTADSLTTALRYLLRDDVQDRAEALGRRLRREDGLANAVRAVTHVESLAPLA